MDVQTIICFIALASIPGAAILMLLRGVFANDKGTNSAGPCGPGPRCDVCGKYLSTHDMYQCESYC